MLILSLILTASAYLCIYMVPKKKKERKERMKTQNKRAEIFQQPHLWSQRSHCCHLLSTLWEICWSSPAPPRSTWASLGTRDCPDSSRWTPEEDAPSSDRRARKDNRGRKKKKKKSKMSVCFQGSHAVLHSTTARCSLLLSCWGDSHLWRAAGTMVSVGALRRQLLTREVH